MLLDPPTPEPLSATQRWVTRPGCATYDFDEGMVGARSIAEWLVRDAKRPRLAAPDTGGGAPCRGEEPAGNDGPVAPKPSRGGRVANRPAGRRARRQRPRPRRPRDREVVGCEQAWPETVLERRWQLTVAGRWELRYLTRWRKEKGDDAYIA